ncbi:SDR family NAD(P)-dependent oxidoreductase [Caulobacter sp. KR2-114]|uniref:SDR family NAD(P)-dependent oxidoreductase n=1 Tax=Caulobacter sp. KR2-114 TaxID=3400912 RepID=UPI003C1181C3
MQKTSTPLAVVTGVCGKLGFALAERCAAGGFDLLVAAADRRVDAAAERLRDHGRMVEPVQIDLDCLDGVDELQDIARVLGRPVDVLVTGPDHPAVAAFLDQPLDAVIDAFDLGVLAPVRLAHRIGREMRQRRRGKILIACAPAAPDAGGAMLCGGNAFLAGFALALREELADDGVSVTCLAPQACCGVAAGETPAEAQAASMARLGFEAMMRGDLGLPQAAATAIAFATGCPPGASRSTGYARARGTGPS